MNPENGAVSIRDAVTIRPEATDGSEAGDIRELTAAAFAGVEQSDGHEPAIIDALRNAGALTLSLVAVYSGRVIGHIAVSPVTLIDQTGSAGDHAGKWFGLGPLSVTPQYQGRGIGSVLMREVMRTLEAAEGVSGAVLLGDPGYYGRFGFAAREGFTMEGLPEDHAEFFQARRLDGEVSYPRAAVRYHPGFGA